MTLPIFKLLFWVKYVLYVRVSLTMAKTLKKEIFSLVFGKYLFVKVFFLSFSYRISPILSHILTPNLCTKYVRNGQFLQKLTINGVQCVSITQYVVVTPWWTSLSGCPSSSCPWGLLLLDIVPYRSIFWSTVWSLHIHISPSFLCT